MVINDKLVQQLISRLPDFYGEYSYDTEFIQELFDAYIKAVGVLYRHAQYICNNTSIETAEVYKPKAMKPIVLEKSLYNVLDISGPFEAKTGKAWFDVTTSLADKVSFLDSVGKYEVLTDINSYFDAEFIIDFKIRKDFSGLLGYYSPLEDYVYKDYKLYLFNQLAKPPHNAISKTILLEDIKSNDHKLDHQWGIFFPTIYSVFLTRPEYRDMIASLLQFDSSIRAINEVMKSINIPETAIIRDKYSRKNIPTIMLNKFDKDLNPFDFVFKLPPEYIGALYYTTDSLRKTDTIFKNYGPEDLNYLYASIDKTQNIWVGRIINIFNFINLIKPEHMNFFLEGSINIFDTYAVGDLMAMNRKLMMADTWLEESRYDFARYDSSVYGSSRKSENVFLQVNRSTQDTYPDTSDTSKIIYIPEMRDIYTINSNPVKLDISHPPITSHYHWMPDIISGMTTKSSAADTFDWAPVEEAHYGDIEYDIGVYDSETIPTEATLLNLFSII